MYVDPELENYKRLGITESRLNELERTACVLIQMEFTEGEYEVFNLSFLHAAFNSFTKTQGELTALTWMTAIAAFRISESTTLSEILKKPEQEAIDALQFALWQTGPLAQRYIVDEAA